MPDLIRHLLSKKDYLCIQEIDYVEIFDSA